MNDKLYFAASDTASGNYELWVTDGTTSGTHIVKEINPNGLGIAVGGGAEIISINNNQLLLFARDSTLNDWELWQSDGTTSGTSFLKETVTMNTNPQPGKIPIVFKNKMYFSGRSDNAFLTWWVTDGTANGTFAILDSIFLLKGKPIIYNDRIYLVASNAQSVLLWEYENDTSALKVIKPLGDTTNNLNPSFGISQTGSISGYDYVEYNNTLLFTSDYGTIGLEPWRLTSVPLKILSYNSKEIDFVLFPNPAQGSLNIQSEESILQAEVFDMHGRKMLSSSKSTIELHGLSNGLYILRVKTDKGYGSATFMIDK